MDRFNKPGEIHNSKYISDYVLEKYDPKHTLVMRLATDEEIETLRQAVKKEQLKLDYTPAKHITSKKNAAKYGHAIKSSFKSSLMT